MGMSRIFLDSNIFIYLIEDRGTLGKRATELLERLSMRRDEVITSALTLGEVLTKPMRENRIDLAEQYEQALSSPGMEILAFDRGAARAYARIRTDKTIKAPDAIQLAVAAVSKCDLFVTNDHRLSKKVIPGIQFISALDNVPI
jgi:predicted nucleic acid-binding protein